VPDGPAIGPNVYEKRGEHAMDPDDHVCLCFHVSQRKLVSFLKREKPRVASRLSECLGAGTGCQWCVRFLLELHKQWETGEEPGLEIAPEQYAKGRVAYHAWKKKERGGGDTQAGADGDGGTDTDTGADAGTP